MRVVSILVISTLMIFSNACAIEAGPQVPITPSTQSSYCPNGVCGISAHPAILANYTYSKVKYNMIIITISEVCKRMNDNGIPGCPKVSDLAGFDNSDQTISGKIIGNMRTNPQIKNHYQFYENRNLPVVCVDCNADFINADLVKQVIIEPHDFVWTDKHYDFSNNTRTFVQFHGRYMAGCDTATLAYDWNLMTDTIYYMRNGCNPKATDYDNTSTYTLPSTPFDMTGQPLKTQSYFKDAKSCIILNACSNINTGKKW